MVAAGHPPNFDRILAAFPDANKPGVIFAYGGVIYNPSGAPIPPALHAHEGVHLHRQQTLFTPEQWWEQYIVDPGFRYNEELLAHVAEYRAQLGGLDRNQKHKLLQATAARLSAPLYRYEGARSFSRALSDLRSAIEAPRKEKR